MTARRAVSRSVRDGPTRAGGGKRRFRGLHIARVRALATGSGTTVTPGLFPMVVRVWDDIDAGNGEGSRNSRRGIADDVYSREIVSYTQTRSQVPREDGLEPSLRTTTLTKVTFTACFTTRPHRYVMCARYFIPRKPPRAQVAVVQSTRLTSTSTSVAGPSPAPAPPQSSNSARRAVEQCGFINSHQPIRLLSASRGVMEESVRGLIHMMEQRSIRRAHFANRGNVALHGNDEHVDGGIDQWS